MFNGLLEKNSNFSADNFVLIFIVDFVCSKKSKESIDQFSQSHQNVIFFLEENKIEFYGPILNNKRDQKR